MSASALTRPDQRYKRSNDFKAPSAPASEPRGSVVRGRDLIALGASYINGLCRNSIQGMYLGRQCSTPRMMTIAPASSVRSRTAAQFEEASAILPMNSNNRGARRDPGRRHSPPGSGGVTPRSRYRRCERIAEAKVRIRSPPAASQLFGCGPEEPYASALDRSLKRRRLRRGRRWQVAHDRPEPSVGFGLKAAVPSRRDEIVDRAIAGIAQGPHQGFRLVEMAHPVVTPMHDTSRDVPQSGDIVENIVVIAIRRAAGAKESAI